MIEIIQKILTRNRCYLVGKTITVKGLMLHSVGCPQPKASVFLSSWNNASCSVCVHGFIDGETGQVYQTLPWNYRGWHCGSGLNGSGNATHIGIEMCEPSCIRYTSGANFTCSDTTAAKLVAERTYQAAVELFAMLCEKFELDPMADGVILSHHEGHERGIASNHGDPEHLWSGLGTGHTMDGFRKDVKALMGGVSVSSIEKGTEQIWNFLYRKIGNAYGAAGLMGNLYAESGLRSDNLQNTFEKSLGMTDAQYTAAVDDGSYGNFVDDKAGYGLAQWTYHTRKEALLNFAREKGKSIGDLEMQMEFLWKELESYSSVRKILQEATDVRTASDAVLTGYEKPADQSETVKAVRAGYGQKFYDQFAGTDAGSKADGFGDCPFLVRVSISNLNIRKGPGTDYKKTGKYVKPGVYTIVDVQNGKGSDKRWGKLKSGVGWIALSYCSKV